MHPGCIFSLLCTPHPALQRDLHPEVLPHFCHPLVMGIWFVTYTSWKSLLACHDVTQKTTDMRNVTPCDCDCEKQPSVEKWWNMCKHEWLCKCYTPQALQSSSTIFLYKCWWQIQEKSSIFCRSQLLSSAAEASAQGSGRANVYQRIIDKSNTWTQGLEKDCATSVLRTWEDLMLRIHSADK